MTDTIARYFAAFNADDTDGMLACLADDVAHHVNEGGIRIGKEKFAEFCAHMSRCYKENLTDLVIFATEDGTRAAAEFTVNDVVNEGGRVVKMPPVGGAWRKGGSRPFSCTSLS